MTKWSDFKITFSDIIGSRLAELHLQLGTLFDPNEALSIGLVDQVCAPEEIDIAAGFFISRGSCVN